MRERHRLFSYLLGASIALLGGDALAVTVPEGLGGQYYELSQLSPALLAQQQPEVTQPEPYDESMSAQPEESQDDASQPEAEQPSETEPTLSEPTLTRPALRMRTLGAPTVRTSMANGNGNGAEEEAPPPQVGGYLINFNDVPVSQYVRFISQITGTNFIFNEEDLKFSVTIVSEEPTDIDYIMSALLQVLEVHGLSVAEQGNQVLIYRDAQLARLATIVSDSQPQAERDEPAIQTRVFSVQNATVDGMAQIVKPLLSESAVVQTSSETGHLVVTDITGNIERVEQLLEKLDAPSMELEIGEYHVRSTYIEPLVELAGKILDPLGGGAVTLVAQPMTDTIYVIASPYMVERALSILEALDAGPVTSGTGAILPPFTGGAVAGGTAGGVGGGVGGGMGGRVSGVVSGAGPGGGPGVGVGGPVGVGFSPGGFAGAVLGQVGGAVEGGLPGMSAFGPRKAQLDTTTFYIYKLQFHQGNEIKIALQDIASSLEASGASNSDLVSTIGTIQWIQTSNSLVISGNRASIEKVKELIQDLDIPLEQVFIEVLVLRTTVANSLRVGVEWGYAQQFLDHGDNPTVVQTAFGNTLGSPNGTPSALNSRLNPANQPLPWPPLNQGIELGIVGRFVSLDERLFTSLGAFINALQTDTDMSIMLNPKILTQDNHTARIFVGSNVAFRETTISEPGSTILSGQIEYRDIGSELVITPILGSGDMVTLEISQTVETFDVGNNSVGAVSGTDTGDQGTTQPVLKSQTETRVSIPDGYFLVLSGQIQESQTRTHQGLPCLGGLPILGAAFSDKAEIESIDNLVIFVRPHIIRTKADMVRVTEAERIHYERASDQRPYCRDRQETLELLNVVPRKPLTHDHYFDPCYDHDPCDVVCCE